MKVEIIDSDIVIWDRFSDNNALSLEEAKELLAMLPIMIGQLEEKLKRERDAEI